VLRDYRGWRTRKLESYRAEEKDESEAGKIGKKIAKEEEKELKKLGKETEVYNKKTRKKIGEEVILGELYKGD